MNIHQQILLKYWGHKSFRPLQEDIIKSVSAGNDTLGLMPTGGGKSITFQIPAIAKKGICLVVTPLIALMNDQVQNLKSKGIKAIAVHSGLTKHEIDIALNNCVYGNIKFLYVSPERLSTEMFQTRLQDMNVNLLAIDEAHCISQWGYDFRPSYLLIAEIRRLLKNVPVIALTATATPEVVVDIQDKLLFKKENLFQKSFERKNLTYLVRKIEDKHEYLLKSISKTKGTGIIYVRNRRETKEISDFLNKNNISADYYHAGLTPKSRELKQSNWKTDKTRVIVSTNAFGMGIDKPDVRFVVHIDIPDSLEAYFQEAGRAGRDEKRAIAAIAYNEADIIKLKEDFIKSYPEIKLIRQVYNALGNYLQIPIGHGRDQVFHFSLIDFAKSYNYELMTAYNSLKFLEREGYIELTDIIDNPSKLMVLASRDELYDFQLKNQNLDAFIKIILRSYTGLFQNYAKVNEQQLAKESGLKKEDVIDYLKTLNKYKIINYIPQKRSPLLVYNNERIDNKSITISKENYALRKKQAEKRLTEITNYIENSTSCRSRLLLSYFGQQNIADCGTCDLCQLKNETTLSDSDPEKIKNEILSALDNESLRLNDLVNLINFPEQKTIKIIQWLLDNNIISYNKNNKLNKNK